jgi:hypothetical protein
MKAEVGFVPTGHKNSAPKRFRGLDSHHIDGYMIQEFEIAVVEITSLDQMDQVIDFLMKAREGFRRGGKRIEPKFDEHEDITGQTNIDRGPRGLLPDGKL